MRFRANAVAVAVVLLLAVRLNGAGMPALFTPHITTQPRVTIQSLALPQADEGMAVDLNITALDADVFRITGDQFGFVTERVLNADGSETIFFESNGMTNTATRKGNLVFATFSDHGILRDLYPEGNGYRVKKTKTEFGCSTKPVVLDAQTVKAQDTAVTFYAPRRRALNPIGPAILSLTIGYCSYLTSQYPVSTIQLYLQHVVDNINVAAKNSDLHYLMKVQLKSVVAIDGCPDPTTTTVYDMMNFVDKRGQLTAAMTADRSYFSLLFGQTKSSPTDPIGLGNQGMAGSMPSSGMYGVVGGPVFMDGSFVGVHEFYHMIGARHQIGAGGGSLGPNDPTPFAAAYYRCGIPGVTDNWLDIMTVYPASCNGAGFAYQRLSLSNPRVEFEGAPIGVPDKEDNARAICVILSEIARWQ